MLKVAVLMITVLLMTGTVSHAKIIGVWLFDDGKGDILKDISGNGHDGVITGGKWIEDGKFGKALEFDSDTFVVVDDPDDVFALPEGLTVTIWAYLTAIPSTWGGIPRKVGSGQDVSGGWVLHPVAEGGGYRM